MTYAAQETGVETGEPIELLVFTWGSMTRRYTNDSQSHVIPSGVAVGTYSPTSIDVPSKIENPGKRDLDFEITLPTSDPVSQFFATPVLPGNRMRLIVYRKHRTDAEVIQWFDGYAFGAGYRDELTTCVISFRPVLASNFGLLPPRTYQGACPYDLYDDDTCKADDTNAAFRASSVEVSSQVGSLLTVGGLGAFAVGWFTGGYVEDIANGDFRTVESDAGAGALTLMYPFSSAPTTVNVFAGCDHTTGTDGCQKFSNVVNYGGFPFVPKINIFQDGLD